MIVAMIATMLFVGSGIALFFMGRDYLRFRGRRLVHVNATITDIERTPNENSDPSFQLTCRFHDESGAEREVRGFGSAADVVGAERAMVYPEGFPEYARPPNGGNAKTILIVIAIIFIASGVTLPFADWSELTWFLR